MTTHTEASVMREFTHLQYDQAAAGPPWKIIQNSKMAAALAEARNALENHDLMVVHSAEVLAELARVRPIVEAARASLEGCPECEYDMEGRWYGCPLHLAVRAADAEERT